MASTPVTDPNSADAIRAILENSGLRTSNNNLWLQLYPLYEQAAQLADMNVTLRGMAADVTAIRFR